MRTTLLTLLLLLAWTATVEAQTRPDPGGLPRHAESCLEARAGSPVPTLEFEGQRFDAAGVPEPIQAENLDSLGTLGGLRVYAGRLAERPVVDLWVPICQPADHYQLYTRLVTGAGLAGS